MGKVTLKGLLARKLRLALTALAIVLGVTFISGTLILTDTLHNTFYDLIGTAYQNIDFQARGVAQFPAANAANAVRNPVPDSLLTTVSHVPGVEAAAGSVGGYAQFVARDGKPIANGSEPTLAQSFDPNPQISALRIVEGHAPSGSDDVVMDAATAQKHGFHVGDQVRVLFNSGVHTFTISGIAQYGGANTLAGVTVAAFALPTAQQLLNRVGEFDTINIVTQPGVDQATAEHAIAKALPPGIEVVSGQTVRNEQTNSINAALSFFSTALVIFALIALFVGAFTIFNTFSIIVSQRTRELALLRVVGASRRQVFRSVLAEAAIVGALASVAGIGLGVLTALGIEALLRGFGVTLPSGSLIFAPRTAAVGLVVGIAVTTVSALGPARRAVRIPPVAALGQSEAQPDVSSRRRITRGAALALAGVVLLLSGLAKPAVALVGAGAACIFIGVAMLAPAVARPLAGAIGRPLARRSVAGALGRENSMRSPRRTAQTASALMIGLALVAAMAVFGASASRSATASINEAVRADLIVSNTSSSGSSNFSSAVPAAVSAVPGVTSSLTVYGGQFEVGSSVEQLRAVSPAGISANLILDMTSGTSSSIADGAMLIDSSTAKSDHLAVGDTVPAKFALTGSSRVRIGGIYQQNGVLGSYIVSSTFFRSHYRNPEPGAVLLRANNTAAVEQRVAQVLRAYPNVQVQSRAQFEQGQTAQVNQLLGLVYALLALAVVIALVGIANTLLLSVFERTREIGLLRAVGMKRRQVRTMIRSESVIIAVFGAIIGLVVGAGLGLALVHSLNAQGITNTVVPVQQLILFLVLAALLGLIAAGLPARRAAKLDVLAALAAM